MTAKRDPLRIRIPPGKILVPGGSRPHFARDFTGQRIGHIRVLKPTGARGQSYVMWDCICDCGNTFHRKSRELIKSLQAKNPKYAVCGLRCSFFPRGVASQRYKGIGDLSARKWGAIKASARNRSISFTVTIKQMWALFIAQDCRCALSGVPLMLSPSSVAAGIETASLDRIDSNRGYILGNVQWVHVSINLMKQTLSVADFVLWCARVSANNLGGPAARLTGARYPMLPRKRLAMERMGGTDADQ